MPNLRMNPSMRSYTCVTARPAMRAHGTTERDLLRHLEECREHLFTINQSRLNALSELQAAKTRISVLEKQVEQLVIATKTSEEARTQHTQAQAETSDCIGASRDMNGSMSPAPCLKAEGDDRESGAGPVCRSITIAYGTGWDKAFLHFNTPSKGWTQVPGQAMQHGSGQLQGSRTATIITDERIEFVLNNGEDQWDSPNPHGGGSQNYAIENPGIYYLKSGKLQRLE